MSVQDSPSQDSISSRRRDCLREGVIYQIYPRSFQDSNGDGVGDINGIISRLDYLRWLGVDGIWLSPIFVSPQVDGGYDVSDYYAISPLFGNLSDFDRLLAEAHDRNIAVLLDMVPCHTSIEHPWFREHPDWYIWHDGDAPPNNWISVFGGSAWSLDELTGRWYLHQFYPEQPQLDWRNPDVMQAFKDVLKFWIDRGVDGFRVDVVQFMFVDEQLRDEPPAQKKRLWGATHPDYALLEHIYTIDQPECAGAMAELAHSVPEGFFVAEIWGEASTLTPYSDSVDNIFCFELIGVAPDATEVASVLKRSGQIEGLAWVLSNHDVSRLATRWGTDSARLAAALLFALPGGAFIYQGDEIGAIDGAGVDPPIDLVGRDACRHPMQWDASGGFSESDPWLPMINAAGIDVESQVDDLDSVLTLYRDLIAIRSEIHGPLSDLRSDGDLLTFRRGDHVVVLNFGSEPRTDGIGSEVLVRTSSMTGPTNVLGFSGYIAKW